jgi:hypothetical protein
LANEVVILSDFGSNTKADIPIVDFDLSLEFEQRDFTSSNSRLRIRIPRSYTIPADHVVIVKNNDYVRFVGFSIGREILEHYRNPALKEYTYYGVEEVIHKYIESADYDDPTVTMVATLENWSGVSTNDADFGTAIQHEIDMAEYDTQGQNVNYYTEKWMVLPVVIAKIFEYLAKEGLSLPGGTLDPDDVTSGILVTDHFASRILCNSLSGGGPYYHPWRISEMVSRYRQAFNLVYDIKWRYDDQNSKWVMYVDFIPLAYSEIDGNNTTQPPIVEKLDVATEELVYKKQAYKLIDLTGNEYESDPGNSEATDINLYHDLSVFFYSETTAYVDRDEVDYPQIMYFKEGTNPSVDTDLLDYENIMHCRELTLQQIYGGTYEIAYEEIITAEFQSIDLPESFELYRDFYFTPLGINMMVTAINITPLNAIDVTIRNYTVANTA